MFYQYDSSFGIKVKTSYLRVFFNIQTNPTADISLFLNLREAAYRSAITSYESPSALTTQLIGSWVVKTRNTIELRTDDIHVGGIGDDGSNPRGIDDLAVDLPDWDQPDVLDTD